MLRRLQAFFVLGVCAVSISAAAQEATTQRPSKNERLAQTDTGTPADEGTPASESTMKQVEPPAATPPPSSIPTPPEPVAEPEGWHTEISGYFRAPVSMGISSRPGPDNITGPSSTQVSYGPNRTVDASYYSFAYTRLQEQDWAEVFVHEKHKHVDAAVGWMGYWYQSVGVRNPDAAWVPGMAYLTLDTDFQVGDIKPNIALTTGAWWPKFGYFEKYDTYTLGRFRQIGGQLKLTVPLGPNFTVTGVGGFGTGRDGSFNYLAPPFYGAITGLDLLAWANFQFAYKKNVDVGVHYNTQWTADPNLTQQSAQGDKSYMTVQAAHLATLGAELNVSFPKVGHFWVSPSIISARNGWALANTGTEVMHSLGGLGIATNYLAWTGSTSDSTGSGTILNLGFLYEHTLSGVRGRARGSMLPDVAVSLFQLLTAASLDLPAGTKISQNSIKQSKYGADVTVQATPWLALMLRYDLVNYDLDHPAYIFSVVTGRVAFSSHFLSGERIYIQYSRYAYGDKMVLSGNWPWGTPLVAGTNVLQAGPYSGKKPDEDVIKLQADIAF